MKLTADLLDTLRQGVPEVSEVKWKAAVFAANQDAFALAHHMIEQGWCDRDAAGMALGDTLNKSYLNLSKTLFQPEALEFLPRAIAERYGAIPVYKFGEAVTLAMTDAGNEVLIRELQTLIGKPVDSVLCLKDELDAAISIHYQTSSQLDDVTSSIDLDVLKNLNEAKQLESSEVVSLSNSLILLALKERCSDIHLQATKQEYLVRFRIDGVLQDRYHMPRDIGLVLVSRFKILSLLDISEKRKPQDGKMVFETTIKNIDIRMSSLPALHGEKLVMRILGSLQETVPMSIDKIDLAPEILQNMKAALSRPNGLLLVTGPTGSGKSTTLYAALNFVDKPDINVLTIEDPVEYEVPAFTQVAVNDKAGRSFQVVLRSVLRQDPDVILVGETRDKETANISAEAALTGHLVLTTLHTNNALLAVTRLQNMGVPSHVLSPSITGILAQRLVRRICSYCKVSYTPDSGFMHQYFHWQPDNSMPLLYRGNKCDKCGGTGYKGRIGIHEFLKVDTTMRNLIAQNASVDDMQSHMAATGFADLRYDGFRKALQGLTTIEEVVRATSVD